MSNSPDKPPSTGAGPARGILIGMIISIPFWGALAYLIWRRVS